MVSQIQQKSIHLLHRRTRNTTMDKYRNQAPWINQIFCICCTIITLLHDVESSCNPVVAQKTKNFLSSSEESLDTGDNYENDSGPDICSRGGGYCLRRDEPCKGHIKLYQTNCLDDCECCYLNRVFFNDQFIEVVRKRRHWKRARNNCKARGGDLYVPRRVDDLIDFLRDRNLHKEMVWVGINENDKEGIYDGVHGNIVKSGWQIGQPISKAQEDNCVGVEGSSGYHFGLGVDECRSKRYFVCGLGEQSISDHDVHQK